MEMNLSLLRYWINLEVCNFVCLLFGPYQIDCHISQNVSWRDDLGANADVMQSLSSEDLLDAFYCLGYQLSLIWNAFLKFHRYDPYSIIIISALIHSHDASLQQWFCTCDSINSCFLRVPLSYCKEYAAR